MSHASPPQSSAASGEQPAQWATATRYVAAAFLILAIGVLLVFLVPVISTVALGFIFAFLMYLPVRALLKHTHMRYPLAVVLLYLLLIILLVLLGIAGYSLFHKNAGNLSADLEAASAGLETHKDAIRQLIADLGASAGAWLAGTLGSLVGGVLGLIGLAAGALFFSFLLLLAMGNAQGTLSGWVPSRYRREATLLLTKLDGIWVGYMVAQVIYGVALGVFSFFEYALIGVPSPFVMAVLTGFISLIPTIGGLLASVIVAIPCLLLGSTVLTDMPNLTFALLVLGINVVITQVTYNFLALPIVGKFVKLPTALVFVGVLVGVALGSIVLAFLAVPILSTLTTIGGYILSKIARREPFPDEEVPDPPKPGFFSQLLI
jgi:predicted PurR-regulated permease PerM